MSTVRSLAAGSLQAFVCVYTVALLLLLIASVAYQISYRRFPCEIEVEGGNLYLSHNSYNDRLLREGFKIERIQWRPRTALGFLSFSRVTDSNFTPPGIAQTYTALYVPLILIFSLTVPPAIVAAFRVRLGLRLFLAWMFVVAMVIFTMKVII